MEVILDHVHVCHRCCGAFLASNPFKSAVTLRSTTTISHPVSSEVALGSHIATNPAVLATLFTEVQI